MTTILDTLLVRTPGTCGGRLRLEGTRITVHRIATLYKQGLSAEEIGQTYPHLALSLIYLALSYYHANRLEIDAELTADDAQYDRFKSESAADGVK